MHNEAEMHVVAMDEAVAEPFIYGTVVMSGETAPSAAEGPQSICVYGVP
jgi:hypothetical protein